MTGRLGVRRYVEAFWHDTGSRQTNRQADRQTDRPIHNAMYSIKHRMHMTSAVSSSVFTVNESKCVEIWAYIYAQKTCRWTARWPLRDAAIPDNYTDKYHKNVTFSPVKCVWSWTHV